MAGSPDAPFRVVCSQNIRDQLQRWLEQATVLGVGTQFRDALRTINQRLSADPVG